MFELIDNHPDSEVQESEYKRLLGYPADHVLSARARELADWARHWYAENGTPWRYARQTNRLDLTHSNLAINGTEIASKQLRDQWLAAQTHTAVLAAVSAGRECEEQARHLWQQGKPDEYFFLEIYGSAVVEHLITNAGGRICAWAEQQGWAALPHYSPGYSGWDLSDQGRLFELIRQTPRFPDRVKVLDSGMLQPKKSLLAVFGITRHRDGVPSLANLVPCQNCSLPSCQYRRVPYRHPLPQLEDVRRLQARRDDRSAEEQITVSGPTQNSDYTVNARALRKWAQERLELKSLPDGSVEARFRYEGTTCSNLGLPLEFHYRVKLQPSANGYRIVETSCVPAPADTGHTFMCEYLNDAESLMTSIAAEKPLLGRPLNEVVTWQRPASPAGCYCDAAHRLHKWGLVFEVIHYALAQPAK